MNKVDILIRSLLVVGGVGLITGANCTKEQKDTARTVIDLGIAGACVLVPFIDDSGKAQEVCVYKDELQQVVKVLLAKRRSVADGGADALHD